MTIDESARVWVDGTQDPGRHSFGFRVEGLGVDLLVLPTERKERQISLLLLQLSWHY